jgi:hypothetical protein
MIISHFRQRLAAAVAIRLAADRDRGSVSILFAVGVVMTVLIIGVVVDGGGDIRAQLQANQIAMEAARTGGQAIDLALAIPGAARQINHDAAKTAILSYLSTTHDLTGADVSLDGDPQYNLTSTQIYVKVRLIYHTSIMTLIGKDTVTIEGAGQATLLTTTG